MSLSDYDQLPDGAQYWHDVKHPYREPRPPGPPGHTLGSIHLHTSPRQAFSRKRWTALCGQAFRATRMRSNPQAKDLNEGAVCPECCRLYDQMLSSEKGS